MPPTDFRKKPIVIQAMQWDGSRESIEELCKWVNKDAIETDPFLSYIFINDEDVKDVRIWTLEGDLEVSKDDWIIKGVNKGEFYPCKPDIFEATYEKVEPWDEPSGSR